MDVVYPQCAGLDVHQKTVVACLHWREAGRKRTETRTFGTTTAELLQILDWLAQLEITHVAMESTGVYWKPVYYILEGHLEVWLVNAQHVKAVPGRKTDVNDAEWLASLLEHGLVRASFIPPLGQRELRDLTRQRANLVRDRTQTLNRLQKILEDANLKLGAVVSDINGVSALEMLRALVAGTTDPAVLAGFARGALRKKKTELEAALTGHFRDHHRFLLAHALIQLDFLDDEIATFTSTIEQHVEVGVAPPPPPTHSDEPSALSPAPTGALGRLSFQRAVELWDSVPGVNAWNGQVLVAEIGVDMGRFPTPEQLASWAGVCPGNNESAGKRRSGAIAPGERPVRKALVQAAWAASHTKGSYLQALYQRLAARRGKKRALIAVAHSILVSAWYMLSRDEPYQAPPLQDLTTAERERQKKKLVKRLHKLGYTVGELISAA